MMPLFFFVSWCTFVIKIKNINLYIYILSEEQVCRTTTKEGMPWIRWATMKKPLGSKGIALFYNLINLCVIYFIKSYICTIPNVYLILLLYTFIALVIIIIATVHRHSSIIPPLLWL